MMKTNTAPKTSAERQKAYRDRKAAAGNIEVRGIFAKIEHHAKIKAYAARLEKDRQ